MITWELASMFRFVCQNSSKVKITDKTVGKILSRSKVGVMNGVVRQWSGL